MKKWANYFIFGLFIATIYLVFIREKFTLVKELPTVFQEHYSLGRKEANKRVFLEKNGLYQPIGFAIDKDKTLYIANSYGEDITNFKINKDKKEIIIKKILFNGHEGDYKFQLIQVPFSKYKEIIHDDNIVFFIDYGLGYEKGIFNIKDQKFSIIKKTNTTK